MLKPTNTTIQAHLARMGEALRSHLHSQGISESQLARAVGVTHPTLSRMLHPERPGGDGVAIRHWFRALQLTGHLQPMVQGIERRTRRLLANSEDIFVPVDDGPVKLTGKPGSPASDEDNVRIDLSLLRVGNALHAAIPANPVRSARQLAMTMGVTQPTLANLLHPLGDHAGGTAMRYFIEAASILRLDRVFEQVLPEPTAERAQQIADRSYKRDAALSPSI